MTALLCDLGGTLDTGGTHWSVLFREAHAALLGADVQIPQELWRDCYVRAERVVPSRIAPGDGFLATLQHQAAAQCHALRMEGVHITRGDRDHSRAVARWCMRRIAPAITASCALLADLHHRHRIAIVSNFYGNLEPACRELGFAPSCDLLLDSTRAGIRKPDPGLLRRALEALGCAPAEAMVVGDSYLNDIVPAHTLGCTTVWLKGRGWDEVRAPVCADHIITDLAELRPVAEAWTGAARDATDR